MSDECLNNYLLFHITGSSLCDTSATMKVLQLQSSVAAAVVDSGDSRNVPTLTGMRAGYIPATAALTLTLS